MLWTLVWRYGRPYLFQAFIVMILQLVSTLAVLYLPTLNAKVIDQGIAIGDTDYILSTGRVMVAVAFIQVSTAIAGVWVGAKISMAMGRDLRRAVYVRVNSLSVPEINSFGTPTLITRNTNDVQQVQMVLLMALNFMIIIPIMSIGGVTMAIREDAGLSWLVWVSVALVLIVVAIFVRRLTPLYCEMQDSIDSINGVVREQILGIRTVRAFAREDYETNRFSQANSALTRTSIDIGRLVILMGPVVTVILHVATAAVLWFGGIRVDQGLTGVGSLTAFMQYLLQILAAVMMGTFMFVNVPRAVVSARRIAEVLSSRSSVDQSSDVQRPLRADAVIELHDVTFAYPNANAPILYNVSLSFFAGQTTAIVGATGSGKSTLLGLIMGLYRPTSGHVLLNGVAVSKQSRSRLASAIGFVPQKPLLFSGTVAENLRFGDPEATDAELWRALGIAQAANFVRDRLTEVGQRTQSGLQSTISQGGTDLSGGQRQRLCIARALVGRPKTYIFDDAFCALDSATDARLRACFASHTRDDTVIMVAQRVATIANADQIIVLEAGRVVGCGTHHELLRDCQTYNEIVDSQTALEEIS